MKRTLQSIRLRTGVTLRYVEQGDPSGVPVVMLHGVTDSWHSFEPVLPHLPSSLRAIALTQRGHGDADRPPGGYRTRDFAADVAAFADALALGPMVVVGHSMGATNAIRFAIDFPRRVLGLVLAGSFASYGDHAALAEFRRSDVARLTDPISRDFVRDFQQSTLAQPVPRLLLDTAIEESLKVPARVWRQAFDGFFEDDFSAELERIDAPVLLVWGDRDALASRHDQDVQRTAMKHSTLVVYEGAGHAVQWEQPARFAADVSAFVRAARIQAKEGRVDAQCGNALASAAVSSPIRRAAYSVGVARGVIAVHRQRA